MFATIAALLQRVITFSQPAPYLVTINSLLVIPKWQALFYLMVDIAALPEIGKNIVQPNTKMLFIEFPSNPGLEITHLEWLVKLPKKYMGGFNLSG